MHKVYTTESFVSFYKDSDLSWRCDLDDLVYDAGSISDNRDLMNAANRYAEAKKIFIVLVESAFNGDI